MTETLQLKSLGDVLGGDPYRGAPQNWSQVDSPLKRSIASALVLQLVGTEQLGEEQAAPR